MQPLNFSLWIGVLASVCVSALAAPSKNSPVLVGKPRSVTLAQGQKGEAVLEFAVAPGFHVQANPASLPQLIATTAFIESAGGIKTGQPQYPTGKKYRQAGADADIMTYDGAVAIKISLEAEKSAKIGKRELAAKLRYQACDDKICLMPETTELKVPVIVTAKK